ncbi:MAG: hypothetical protein LBH04_00010 [Tannerellaceae bacterium]|jgi:hypothetical protein|nr:hypothetical protein [Tannerellaceae bacterium]
MGFVNRVVDGLATGWGVVCFWGCVACGFCLVFGGFIVLVGVFLVADMGGGSCLVWLFYFGWGGGFWGLVWDCFIGCYVFFMLVGLGCLSWMGYWWDAGLYCLFLFAVMVGVFWLAWVLCFGWIAGFLLLCILVF